VQKYLFQIFQNHDCQWFRISNKYYGSVAQQYGVYGPAELGGPLKIKNNLQRVGLFLKYVKVIFLNNF